ncbi:hypothetical protein AAT19DRAFT_13061, partial [Rhodotorula toruloides]
VVCAQARGQKGETNKDNSKPQPKSEQLPSSSSPPTAPLSYLVDENLVTALVPSEMACFESSPGRMRRTEVWISREMVDFLLYDASCDGSCGGVHSCRGSSQPSREASQAPRASQTSNLAGQRRPSQPRSSPVRSDCPASKTQDQQATQLDA